MARESVLTGTRRRAERAPADLLLTIDHPHGSFELPLSEWIQRGPGPRDLLRPRAVRDRQTGKPLPLRVVPLRYRNNRTSRALVRLGLIRAPWTAQS